MKKFLENKIVHFSIIMIVFACTGLTAARVGGFLGEWLGLDRATVLYWVVWVVAIFPLYQLMLLFYAFIFGKFKYFREKQKKTFRFLGRLFTGKLGKKKESQV